MRRPLQSFGFRITTRCRFQGPPWLPSNPSIGLHMLSTSGTDSDMQITKPNRATHTYRQTLRAPPAKVFPLLCPVREAEWAEGWLPELVISSSGIAEGDCVFL